MDIKKTKEILDGLDKIIAFLKTDDDFFGAGDDIEKIKDQALAELASSEQGRNEQPEPGEFTKEFNQLAQYLSLEFVKARGGFTTLDISKCKYLLAKACGIIDRLTAENKNLKNNVPDCCQLHIQQAERIKELKAKISELIKRKDEVYARDNDSGNLFCMFCGREKTD
jgi:hypothetical protein